MTLDTSLYEKHLLNIFSTQCFTAYQKQDNIHRINSLFFFLFLEVEETPFYTRT